MFSIFKFEQFLAEDSARRTRVSSPARPLLGNSMLFSSQQLTLVKFFQLQPDSNGSDGDVDPTLEEQESTWRIYGGLPKKFHAGLPDWEYAAEFEQMASKFSMLRHPTAEQRIPPQRKQGQTGAQYTGDSARTKRRKIQNTREQSLKNNNAIKPVSIPPPIDEGPFEYEFGVRVDNKLDHEAKKRAAEQRKVAQEHQRRAAEVKKADKLKSDARTSNRVVQQQANLKKIKEFVTATKTKMLSPKLSTTQKRMLQSQQEKGGVIKIYLEQLLLELVDHPEKRESALMKTASERVCCNSIRKGEKKVPHSLICMLLFRDQ